MALDRMVNHGTWMKAIIASILINTFLYWFYLGYLPAPQYFLITMFFSFVVIYFTFEFFRHHFLLPVKEDIRRYLNQSCTDDDQSDGYQNMPMD